MNDNKMQNRPFQKNLKKKYYLIVHQSNDSNYDYTTLNKEIKKADAWWHYMDQVWIIETELDRDYWFNTFDKFIARSDIFLITEFGPFNAKLQLEDWDWLIERFNIILEEDK